MGADLRGTEPWVQELGRWVEHGRQAGTNSLKGGGTGDRAMNVRIKPPSTTRQQQARKWEEPTAFYPFLIFNSKKIPSVQVCKRKSILLWQIPCCAIFLYFFACARSSWLEKNSEYLVTLRKHQAVFRAMVTYSHTQLAVWHISRTFGPGQHPPFIGWVQISLFSS
jgi:hypothetical protein